MPYVTSNCYSYPSKIMGVMFQNSTMVGKGFVLTGNKGLGEMTPERHTVLSPGKFFQPTSYPYTTMAERCDLRAPKGICLPTPHQRGDIFWGHQL